MKQRRPKRVDIGLAPNQCDSPYIHPRISKIVILMSRVDVS
jgi:hypothetical protein